MSHAPKLILDFKFVIYSKFPIGNRWSFMPKKIFIFGPYMDSENFCAPGTPLNDVRSTLNFFWDNLKRFGTKSEKFVTKIQIFFFFLCQKTTLSDRCKPAFSYHCNTGDFMQTLYTLKLKTRKKIYVVPTLQM